ncbi:MAG TPA: hypothetical protein VNM90_24740 [Haliangium sp.]|nr:hypothetical protein [Haliangium sp.]
MITIARENPGWGYTRIRDALGNLGHEIARNTIKAILKVQGIEPAPERSKRISWQTFLRSHWDAIAACDFFTVEVLTWTGLTRFYVLFVIALETRRVEIAGIIRQPHGAWMLQVARNLLDSVDGFLTGKRFLLLDRDPLYTSQFQALLSSAGVSTTASKRASSAASNPGHTATLRPLRVCTANGCACCGARMLTSTKLDVLGSSPRSRFFHQYSRCGLTPCSRASTVMLLPSRSPRASTWRASSSVQ